MKITALKGRVLVLAAAVLAIATMQPLATATTVTFGGTAPSPDGIFSTVPGVTTVDFNSGSAPAWYSLSGDAQVANGSTTNVFKAPTGDTSDFLTTGSTSAAGAVSIDVTAVSSTVNYFGLHWGSLDAYNTIVFSLSDGSTQSYTGTQIAALGGLETDGDSSPYVNFFADAGLYFTGINLTSNGYAFESDNHAFGSASPIPEPSTLSMLGSAALALGVGLFRRRRSAK